MGHLALAATLNLSGHEVAPHDIERSRPSVDLEPVAHAERLEPVVVTHRVAIVLALVTNQVDAEARVVEARQAAVIVHGQVADRTARQLDEGRGWGPVGQSTSPAEGRIRACGGRPTLEASEGERGG